MKLISIILLLLAIQTALIAQSNTAFFLVNFKDKGNSAHLKSITETFLSRKSLERRQKQNISIETSDLPVNQYYVNQVTSLGAKIITKSRWFNYVVIECPPATLEALEELTFIKKISPLDNSKTDVTENTSKSFFRNESFAPNSKGNIKSVSSNTYNYGSGENQIIMMKGEFLHNHGFSGQGMTIAVLDAGFNSVDFLPAFDSIRLNNQIKGVKDFVDPAGNVYNTNISAHGTMVLSTMAALIPGELVGTAPKADYWLLRSEDAASEYIMEEYYWVNAAEYADSIGADLINSSLGYTTFDDPASNHTYADMDGNTTYITLGADMAASKGILVVNSAGNSGADPWTYIGAPADGDSVFTVGAVDAFGNYAYFSSKGPTSDGRIKPVISSQGQNSAVYSPWGLGFGSGTSFSSPIIAGITACYWQTSPSLTNMHIIENIKSTANLGTAPDTLIGWGIPNFADAYYALGNSQVEESILAGKLKTYPNPFNDVLEVQGDVSEGQAVIEIFTMQGKKIYVNEQLIHRNTAFNLTGLSFLPSGIYILKVRSQGAVLTTKIQKS
ncbi:MAG: S8 family serine peptidase [Bacteroidales bacterium]|nr:S8 family serine peptidase [Bacteroidales bacterium]